MGRERHTLTTPHGSDIHSHIFCRYNCTARLRKPAQELRKTSKSGNTTSVVEPLDWREVRSRSSRVGERRFRKETATARVEGLTSIGDEGTESGRLQQVLGSPRQSRENEKRVADQSNTGADQVSRVEEWNCGTWKEEPRVASPERNGISWKRVATPASELPESNPGRGARASTDNLVRASGSDGPWHTESETRLGLNGLEERERGPMPHIVRRRTTKELQRGTQWDAYELGMERAVSKISAGKGSVHRGAWRKRAQERETTVALRRGDGRLARQV